MSVFQIFKNLIFYRTPSVAAFADAEKAETKNWKLKKKMKTAKVNCQRWKNWFSKQKIDYKNDLWSDFWEKLFWISFPRCHWNRKSISTNNLIKMSLLYIYNLLHKFNIICLAETYLALISFNPLVPDVH